MFGELLHFQEGFLDFALDDFLDKDVALATLEEGLEDARELNANDLRVFASNLLARQPSRFVYLQDH